MIFEMFVELFQKEPQLAIGLEGGLEETARSARQLITNDGLMRFPRVVE